GYILIRCDETAHKEFVKKPKRRVTLVYSDSLASLCSFWLFRLMTGFIFPRLGQKCRPGNRRSIVGRFASRLTKISRPTTPNSPVKVGHLGVSSGKLLKS